MDEDEFDLDALETGDEENLEDLQPDSDTLGDDGDGEGDGRGGEYSAEAGDGSGADEGANALQVKPQSRAEARVEASRRDVLDSRRVVLEAQERADRLEREIADLRANTQRQNDAEREARILENLDPLERIEYRQEQHAKQIEARFLGIQRDTADANDKSAFAAKCMSDPRLAKIADEVEQALAQSRVNGVTIPRETVAIYLLGQKMLAGAPKARAKQVKTAAANTARQQGRPVSGGSDVNAGTSKDERAARNQRLREAVI